MRKILPLGPTAVLHGALIVAALSSGCSSDEGPAAAPDGGVTGGASSGGASSGGASSGGGGTASTGGTTTGGAQSSSGGSGNSAGGTASGGASSGGANSGGSSPGSGGSPSSGGSSGSGGSASGGTGSGGEPTRPGWKLVWSDEFNGPAGSAVDGSKWNLVNKGDGFGNNELQFYRNGTQNAAMDGNGSLVITAKKETYQNRQYTSARLESNGKYEVKYGRIESRLQVPKGQGIWPAFWMLGNDISQVSWPNCGEIDIMENIGKEPTIVHGTLHGPGYSGGNAVGAAYTLPNGGKFADAFHEFAVEWEENVVRFYVDGNLYQTRKPSDVPGRWVYDHPHFLLLNVAVGGQWPGSPDSTTTFPQTMKVDYVRVYGR